MDSGLTFCCCDPNETIGIVLETLQDFGTQFILTEKSFFIKNDKYFEVYKEISLFKRQILILKSNKHQLPKLRKYDQKIMFAARTSGTTGKSKIIHVPYTCFWPNIECIRFGIFFHKVEKVSKIFFSL